MCARLPENLHEYTIKFDDTPIGRFLYCCHHSSEFCFASLIRSPVYGTFPIQTSKNWVFETFSDRCSFLGQFFDSSCQSYEISTVISKPTRQTSMHINKDLPAQQVTITIYKLQ